MRLIDADKVKFKFPHGFDNNGILMVPYHSCKCSLDNAPTVDAVPVVRCRECKFYFPDSTNPCVLSIGLTMVDEDDFCSYGERRDVNG